MADQTGNNITIRELGGGVAALLFRDGPMNPETALEAADRLAALATDHLAVVLEGEGNSLCGPIEQAGIAAAVQAGDRAAMEKISAAYQQLTQAVRFSAIPVVALARGNVTDFALELSAASALALVAEDAQVGYQTASSGQPSMGGGLVRATLEAYAAVAGVPGADVIPFLKRAFQMLYSGKLVAGAEADAKGYLPKGSIVVPSEKCMPELAAELARCVAQAGYRPPEAAGIIAKGVTAQGALNITVINMNLGGFLPDSLLRVAREISRVLAGGDVPDRTEVSEVRLLTLEREAFVRVMIDS